MTKILFTCYEGGYFTPATINLSIDQIIMLCELQKAPIESAFNRVFIPVCDRGSIMVHSIMFEDGRIWDSSIRDFDKFNRCNSEDFKRIDSLHEISWDK